jgi:hypothetical protein
MEEEEEKLYKYMRVETFSGTSGKRISKRVNMKTSPNTIETNIQTLLGGESRPASNVYTNNPAFTGMDM